MKESISFAFSFPLYIFHYFWVPYLRLVLLLSSIFLHILLLLFMPVIYILTSNQPICPALNSWETPVPQLSFPCKDLIFGQLLAHWASGVHLHWQFRSKVWFWCWSPGYLLQPCFSCQTTVASNRHQDHGTKVELVQSKNSQQCILCGCHFLRNNFFPQNNFVLQMHFNTTSSSDSIHHWMQEEKLS